MSRRLSLSKINRPPVSLSCIAKQARLHAGSEDKIIVTVSTVTHDEHLLEITVATLRSTRSAQEHILNAGDETSTLDQLALCVPTGGNYSNPRCQEQS